MGDENIFLVIGFWLSMFGALIAIGCYLPGVIKVFKYKDTRSISILMFILTAFGCLIWIIIGAVLIVGYLQTNTGRKLIESLASGTGSIISNFGLCTCSVLILVKKIGNMCKAKKLHMSEDEYYKKVVEPSIKKQK